MNDAAIDYSIAWWKGKHDRGYFPRMKQHLDWKVYESFEPCFLGPMDPRPDDDALEIGCGYGQRMIPMARLVRTVVGVDIHPGILAMAAVKFEEHGLGLKRDGDLVRSGNAVVVLGDGKSIPFPDASLSLVYSISVFQHMPRALVALYMRETARVLRPGGRALFHFRADNGNGPYSQDITADHRGDWSVGWTVDDAVRASGLAGLETYYTWADSPDSIVTMARHAKGV